jgi:threonylcarbamoyladenosine tRNA methylthiotransferase MtaB
MDVMAGFPGEEESHFENTLALIEETRPIRVHAFPYSRRSGTRAAGRGEFPRALVRERMNRLTSVLKSVAERERERFVNRTLPVLVENKSAHGELYQGHTPHYLKVYFEGLPERLGQTVSVRVLQVWRDGLIGHWERN